MARNRTISPDFWTWEEVIDCAPMTRLLFIGLWNFADDFGVQPLRPRTIRMQVFPGDDIDGDQVRAMIDELTARKLVRIYEVEGVEYLAVVDWAQHHRVGKRARRRFPSDDRRPLQGSSSPGPSAAADLRGEQADEPHLPPDDSNPLKGSLSPGPSAAPVLSGEQAGEPQVPSDDSNPLKGSLSPGPSAAPDLRGEQAGEPQVPSDDSKSWKGSLSLEPSVAPDLRAEKADEPQRWRGLIKSVMHDYWPRHARIEAMDDAAADRWTAKWIAEGCDYGRDVVPAVRDFYVMTPFGGPPVGFQDLDAAVARNRARGAAMAAARPRAMPAEPRGELN